MPSVHLSRCSFAHLPAQPVLDRVDLDLGPGWTGLVGANGSGKTTLLRILAGELQPGAGARTVVAEVAPVCCPQPVEALTRAVSAFACDWDGGAQRLKARLELDVDDLERWPTLSPGERKRWQIGAALASRPHVLLLDEPTNHLDGRARDLLTDALTGFVGVGVVVSHDRALLDRLTSSTVRLQQGRVQHRRGNYSTASAAWAAEDAALRAAHDRARRTERRARRQLAAARDTRVKAEHDPAAERRGAGHRDHDAHSTARTFAADRAEQRLARQVAVRRSKLERATRDVSALQVRRQRGGPVTFDSAPAPRSILVALERTEVRAGDRVLLADVQLTLRRDDRVHLCGPNGSGKTALRRHLVEVVERAGRRVGVLEQELPAAALHRLAAQLRDCPPDERGTWLALAARLGADPDRLLSSAAPSPGEARKLALAGLLTATNHLLVLDEPTNHLDLPAIETLQDALTIYHGALLLITHDDQLAAAATNRRWRITAGQVVTSEPTVPNPDSPRP